MKIQILLALVLLFLVGCNQRQQAVNLYVDAVRLTEFDDNEKAIEKLNASLELDESFSLTHSLLGEIYYEMKDYNKSSESYEKATKLNPWSFRDYFNLGKVYRVIQKFKRAVKAYARACEIKPDHLRAHLNTSECYIEIKDFNNALNYVEKAEKINPEASEVKKLLGDIYELQKDHEQAIRSYKRALEIDSNNPDIMLALAIAYLRDNRPSSAKELLMSVTQNQPDNNAAFQYLGYCYLQLKKIDKATQSYNRAIAIDAKDWQAYRGLGVAYMLRAINDKDDFLKAKAIQQWRHSLKIKPDQPRRERLNKLIEKYTK